MTIQPGERTTTELAAQVEGALSDICQDSLETTLERTLDHREWSETQAVSNLFLVVADGIAELRQRADDWKQRCEDAEDDVEFEHTNAEQAEARVAELEEQATQDRATILLREAERDEAERERDRMREALDEMADALQSVLDEALLNCEPDYLRIEDALARFRALTSQKGTHT